MDSVCKELLNKDNDFSATARLFERLGIQVICKHDRPFEYVFAVVVEPGKYTCKFSFNMDGSFFDLDTGRF